MVNTFSIFSKSFSFKITPTIESKWVRIESNGNVMRPKRSLLLKRFVVKFEIAFRYVDIEQTKSDATPELKQAINL